MARKTVSVDFVKTRVNALLAAPTPTASERLAAAAVLESVLMETDNYKGFKYLSSEWDASTESLREGYDESRRFYF